MKKFYIYDLQNNTQPHEIDFNAEGVLKNEQVYEKYKQIKRYPPIDNKIREYYDIYYQPDKVLYFSFNKMEMFTRSFLNESPLIKTVIDRHIKHSNYLLNDEGFDMILKDFGKRNTNLPDFYDLIEQPEYIKTKLYDYQRDNLSWMIDVEKSRIMMPFTDHKFCVLDDERIYDYYLDEFVDSDYSSFTNLRFRGGILMDDVGIGKTIQALSLISFDNSPNTSIKLNCIIVPNHLVDYWRFQIETHIRNHAEFWKRVKLMSFDSFLTNGVPSNTYRMIVDEIHETFNNSLLIEKLCFSESEYKWGLTATPWVNTLSLFYIVSYLTNHRFHYKHAVRMKEYYRYYEKIFRKNTKDEIQKEVYIPPLHIFNILIEFSQVEKNLYESEKSANEHCNIDFLRELCGYIDMDMQTKYNSQIVLDHFENCYQKELELLNKYKNKLDQLYISLQNNMNIQSEIEDNIKHYRTLYERQEQVKNSRLFALNRYKEGIVKLEKVINENNLDSVSESVEECMICYQTLVNSIAYYKCGHYICYDCSKISRKENNNCPYCRIPTGDDELYVIAKKKQHKYNSKINRLLDLIKSKNEKFVIYTQFEKVLTILNRVLTQENITNIVFSSQNEINTMIQNNQILLISNLKNASGIDLTAFNNIIIFEPFQDKSCWKQIEQQMIGRLYRIGQKKETNVFRLIINNTIESDLYQVNLNA